MISKREEHLYSLKVQISGAFTSVQYYSTKLSTIHPHLISFTLLLYNTNIHSSYIL